MSYLISLFVFFILLIILALYRNCLVYKIRIKANEITYQKNCNRYK